LIIEGLTIAGDTTFFFAGVEEKTGERYNISVRLSTDFFRGLFATGGTILALFAAVGYG
jgi:hypothetical protein